MSAPKKFLGKSVRSTGHSQLPKRSFGRTWLLLFSAPALLFMGISLAAPQVTQNPETSSLRQVRVLGATPTNPCDTINGKSLPLFPLIPKEIREADTKKSDGTVEKKCNPQSWNRAILSFLIFRLLAILNYLAAAIAVIATVYGGILYLTGFASEQSIKKAKSVIIGAYVGFAIVLLARLLVQGSFFLFGDGSTNLQDVTNLEK